MCDSAECDQICSSGIVLYDGEIPRIYHRSLVGHPVTYARFVVLLFVFHQKATGTGLSFREDSAPAKSLVVILILLVLGQTMSRPRHSSLRSLFLPPPSPSVFRRRCPPPPLVT